MGMTPTRGLRCSWERCSVGNGATRHRRQQRQRLAVVGGGLGGGALGGTDMHDETEDPRPSEASSSSDAEGRGGRVEPDKESSADDGLVNFSLFGDWTSWSSALVLVALFPVTAACLWPMAVIVGAVLPGGASLWALLYFAALPVVLIPGLEFLQVWLIGRGTRRPTAEELAVLEPAFEDVRSRLGRRQQTPVPAAGARRRQPERSRWRWQPGDGHHPRPAHPAR